MNTTIQAILNRRSIRNFSPAPLKQEEIDALVAAALASPTAMNRQLWEFRFITSQSLIAAMNDAALCHFRETGDQAALDRIAARHESIFYGAPLLVVIAMPAGAGRYAPIDAGIAAQNLAIAAQSLGLGCASSGWRRHPSPEPGGRRSWTRWTGLKAMNSPSRSRSAIRR